MRAGSGGLAPRPAAVPPQVPGQQGGDHGQQADGAEQAERPVRLPVGRAARNPIVATATPHPVPPATFRTANRAYG